MTGASVAADRRAGPHGQPPAAPARSAPGCPPRSGALSYSLYLWHWPTIVFLPLLARRHDAAVARARPPRSSSAMTLAALISYRLWERPLRFGVGLRIPSRRVVARRARGLRRAGPDERPAAAAAQRVRGPRAGLGHRLRPAGRLPVLRARLARARRPAEHACVLRRGGAGAPTVALVGDSHAHQWQPALERARASATTSR